MEQQTIEQRIKKNQFTNVAGIVFPSHFQSNSLYTLAAWFKDGNKTYCHSWRQEIRSKTQLIDQEHAYKRLFALATTCSCKINSRNCFFCNHQSIIIYCNLTDKMIFKSAHKNVKALSDLSFAVGNKGNVYLSKLNGESLSKLSVLHAQQNLKFNLMNK